MVPPGIGFYIWRYRFPVSYLTAVIYGTVLDGYNTVAGSIVRALLS